MIPCVVVGGGAAGMLCAGFAGEKAKTLVIEKNRILGKKLLITGKGRCNLTNNCEIDKLLSNVRVNKNFLYSAFSRFSATDTMDLFISLGVELKTERGNRVFPQSDKSSDITEALKLFMRKNNVSIVNDELIDIQKSENSFHLFLKSGNKLEAQNVVLATGGKSYPLTGSTGQGYVFAKKLGHTITSLTPSLVPIEILELELCKKLQGLSLKNSGFKIIRDNKIIYSDFGELMFTHFGVSGPCILSGSAYAKSGDTILIDLKPALSEKQLDARILSDFSENKNKNFSNSLSELLPSKLIPVIIELSGIPPEAKVNSITKEQRLNLLSLLKNFKLTIKNHRPIEEAIITSGGVNVAEIDPKTMQSKLVKGLYFAGEIIDCDAFTGGFNLQIAFSTAYLAAKSIIMDK